MIHSCTDSVPKAYKTTKSSPDVCNSGRGSRPVLLTKRYPRSTGLLLHRLLRAGVCAPKASIQEISRQRGIVHILNSLKGYIKRGTK